MLYKNIYIMHKLPFKCFIWVSQKSRLCSIVTGTINKNKVTL